MNIKLLSLFALFCVFHLSLFAADRAAELRDEMWNSKDKDFKATVVPAKWDGESAVIIAQLNRFEYKKVLMSRNLKYNMYSHYRIKLMDKKSVEEYHELSYYSDDEFLKVYVGVKLIKPNGKEIIVDLAGAVEMERQSQQGKIAYKKIAVPNLEPGDILDYYICEEKVFPVAINFYFFDPVIHNLPQEYPLMKQKLQFLVQRKCFISLRSFNGAPELKLVTDEAKDEQYYSLEDSDREGIKDVRWLYPNRELPSVKFRASFSTGPNPYGALLGDQGIVKNSVTSDELFRFISSMTYGVISDTKGFSKYLKQFHSNETDPVEISKLAYYYQRNAMLASDERSTLDQEDHVLARDVTFATEFTQLLRSKKIASGLVITVPRHISALDDILFERELECLVRVKGKNDEYIYFSPTSVFSIAGDLSPWLEGTEAYVRDASDRSGKVTRIVLPVTSAEKNSIVTTMNVKVVDLTTTSMEIKRTLTGVNRVSEQYALLDTYDAIDEDDKMFEPHESFKNFTGPAKKKYSALKQEFLARKEKARLEHLKDVLKGEYEFKTTDPVNFKIEQTGRQDQAPALVYSFSFTSDELIRKAGPNYIFDLGKLIEGQVKIEGDELKRDYNVYFDNARAFNYKIVLEIPGGYEVQGIEKLNQRIENKSGGFTSSARQEGNTIVVDTHKHYDTNFATKEEWRGIVDFLNAANTFTEQKILLKKK